MSKTTRLIFIEGVSGVGKTTTASRLCEKLRGAGASCCCHLEGDSANPLDPFCGVYPPKMPLELFTETYTKCWRRFADNQLGRETVFILDGTLLHHQINDLLRGWNASDDAIADHLTSLLQIIQPLNPVLFYLTSYDVGQRLAGARESRSQSAATPKQIAFWEERKRVDMLVLSRLPISSHVINVDSGWDGVLRIMCTSIDANVG